MPSAARAALLQRLLQRIVSSPSVNTTSTRSAISGWVQQVDALRQRRRQRSAAFRRDVRIEGIQIQRKRRAIHRQRTGCSSCRECREPETIAIEVLDETPRSRSALPAGSAGVFCQIEREMSMAMTS